MKQLGLIGFPLSHSFSKKYFTKKFEKEHIKNWQYDLFPIETIDDLPSLLHLFPELEGLNVTIPYKEEVIPFLHDLDSVASEIGAVNTIRFREGKLIGYNTDVIGFKDSLLAFLNGTIIKKALILGTGGAAKAIEYVLKDLEIEVQYVSRKSREGVITYADLDETIMQEHALIVNTTPLGTYPKEDTCPDLPYNCLNEKHFLFDLVYNPEKTLFLTKGAKEGAAIQNGLPMLIGQAEAAWEIWQK